MPRHLIQGREVTMPVRVRDATVCTATYPVRADAARAVIAYSGLDVAEVLPGRAICTLIFVDYTDGDLDAYREFGVTFLVRAPGDDRRPGRGPFAGLSQLRERGLGTFVHWLPVDQEFTLEAGRSIWGYPKELADIDLRLASPYKRCIVRKDGRLVVDLLLRPGVPTPSAGAMVSLTSYTHLDGVTRSIPASMAPRGVRLRPGGALIRLGNHPIAKELSELGLPRRPLMSSSSAHVAMSFGAATDIAAR